MSSCSVSTSERLYNPHLRITKMVKEFMVSDPSSNRLRIGEGQRGGKSFAQIKLQVLLGFNLLLSATERDGELSQTSPDFSKRRHDID